MGQLGMRVSHFQRDALESELATTTLEHFESSGTPIDDTSETAIAPQNRRVAIDTFLQGILEHGTKATRRDIWRVAGYKDATEFERFQRGASPPNHAAVAAFSRILNMKAEAFVRILKKQRE
jgi:hypothetical protein